MPIHMIIIFCHVLAINVCTDDPVLQTCELQVNTTVLVTIYRHTNSSLFMGAQK